MMKAARDFSIAVDGHMKNYRAGDNIPADVVKVYNLKAKGLVVATKDKQDD